jgi:hypothetical protein
MEINAEGEMEIRVEKDGTIAITGAKVLTLLGETGPESGPDPEQPRKRRRRRRKTAQIEENAPTPQEPPSEEQPRKTRKRRGRPPKDDDYSANIYRLELKMSLQDWCKDKMGAGWSREDMLEALKKNKGIGKTLSAEEIETDLKDMLGMLGFEG